jgi:fatty-acyl-CoA synthase
VHLWTLPMFHCNGWCFPWAVTAAAATHVCLPKVDAAEVWRLIREEGVTHLNGAPTVLSMIAYAKEAAGGIPRDRVVRIATGGAPPSPAILRRMGELGFEVMHLYGLTEAHGPAMLCDWRPEWDGLDADAQARLKARQGVGNMITFTPRVIADDGSDVPADGSTTGQIVLRGNNLMLGYFKDPEATAAAAPDGWFRTGDVGVVHPDGYVEVRDRSKDVIISGGENIASVEVEQVIMDHPAVLEAAVVAVLDERWGEVPAAYVTLLDGASVTEAEIIDHVKAKLARFKAPKTVTFGELPKTSTGKIQKFALRQKASAAQEHRAE